MGYKELFVTNRPQLTKISKCPLAVGSGPEAKAGTSLAVGVQAAFRSLEVV